MHCASCGSSLPDNALFCPGCGQRLTFQRTSAPQPPPRQGFAELPPQQPLPQRPPAQPPVVARDDVRAAVATRRELGERMEDEIIDDFLERIDRTLEGRIEQRVAQRLGRTRAAAEQRARNFTGRIAASLGIGIPLTAIAGGIGEVPGIVAVWAGIVALNVYYSETERRQ